MLIPRRAFIRDSPRTILASPTGQPTGGSADAARSLKIAPTAEEIVATKVDQFAQDRLRITRAMAKPLNLKLPDEVEQFFKAVAAGRWDELNVLYGSLQKRRDGGGGEELRKVWGPILEGLLIAECAHSWPAQKLLDYGQATLGSLASGMVYVGGTDPGRGIPTLLNETSEGERHIVITQNGLADATYLDYVRFLYGNQMTTLNEEDSKRAFSDYLADAQKRFEHDRQFPEEPKQVRPGEDIQLTDDSGNGGTNGTRGKIQVSGQVAVMAINERLLQAIMDKNPGLSFALEESFPLRTTYSTAVPLGPIMELRAPDAEASFTPERATETLEYWRTTAQQLVSDPQATEGSEVRKTYSHMAASQANLLADHNFTGAAEGTYRLALQLEPSNPEPIYSLAQLLARTGRSEESLSLIEGFRANNPDQPAPSGSSSFSVGEDLPAHP
jgi:hypothetical protein